MIMILGAMTVAGGAFLFLWYRIAVSLPVQKRPRFVHTPAFKWGVPALAGMLFLIGCVLMARMSVRYAVAAALMSGLVAFLLIYFDQYSANARLIYGHYKAVRTENPDLDEIEVLFETASWRYPDWVTTVWSPWLRTRTLRR